MGKIKFIITIVIAVYLVVGFSGPSPVYACSGVGLPLDKRINLAEVIVKAEAVQIDEDAQNGIIHVESYLKGGPGPEFLLVTQTHPAVFAGMVNMYAGMDDCDWARARLVLNQSAYYFLVRNDWGSYAVAPNQFNADRYVFPSPESKVKLIPMSNEGESEYVDLTEAEFTAYIAEYVDEPPTDPLPDTPMPRTAPLQIITDQGMYVLPMDSTIPIELTQHLYLEILNDYHGDWPDWVLENVTCDVRLCATQSPDLRHTVFPDGGRVFDLFDYLAYYQFEGQSFLFSPDGNVIALWQENRIDTIHYTSEFGWGWYHLATVALDYGDGDGYVWLADHAAWTPDGRLLAFSDARGLWLWSPYHPDTEPRLLIPAGDHVPYARYFSPRGRYLAFTEGDQSATLDIIMGTRLPDGIISQDETRMLVFDTSADLAPFTECTLTPFACEEQDSELLLKKAEWVYDSTPRFIELETSYLAVTCPQNDPATCTVSQSGWSDTLLDDPVTGTAFAYESASKILAILSSPTTIQIGDEVFDLADWIDGEIVSIEWMRSELYMR